MEILAALAAVLAKGAVICLGVGFVGGALFIACHNAFVNVGRSAS